MNELAHIGYQLDLFYSCLDKRIAADARAAAERIRGRMQLASESVIEIGRELIAQKDALGHGNFLRWIAAEFAMSELTAQNMMSVGRRYADKSPSLGVLGREALYALASPSTPPEVREPIEALIADGEKFTAADIKALRAAHAEAKIALDNADKEKIDALEKARAKAERELKKLAKKLGPEKDTEIAALKQQLDDIRNSPVMQAVRDTVEQAAKDAQSGKKIPAGKNPVHKPNPGNAATLQLIGPIRSLAERIPAMEPAKILAGFIDEHDRANGLKAVGVCRDFLSQLLEEANATRSA